MIDMDAEKEQENEAWKVIETICPELAGPFEETTLRQFFDTSSRMCERLAVAFISSKREKRQYVMVCTDQLFAIANHVSMAELDIDECPGMYLFVRINTEKILKIGQTNNFRRRIAEEHLIPGDCRTLSTVIMYCQNSWPVCLSEDKIVALLFPMYQSSKEERCFIELGLHQLLFPEMP